MLLVMKQIIIKLYSVFISLYYYFLWHKSVDQNNIIFFRSVIRGVKNNEIKLNQARIKYSNIHIHGQNNYLELNQCNFNKTTVLIVGENNLINISPDVNMNSTHIVLRGNNCQIKIGRGTTFGSAYIVCMGRFNSIQIGEECMFAENVEIWNSDSHPIFDNEGILINPSKPIYIDNHVWCGKGCKILKGVTIGENAVIGMETLVTKDINSGTMNVGIPAREVRKNINWRREFITK